MKQFYLVPKKNEHFECGTLIKSLDDNVIIIDPTNLNCLVNCNTLSSCIELSELKMNYLHKREMKKRLDIHNSGLFERIEKLKNSDECYIINGRYRERCSIVERTQDKFIVNTKNEKEKIISILDIDLIVNIEYFICLGKYGGIEPGMLVIAEDNAKKTYPEGYFVLDSFENMSKIHREKANFLFKYSYEERLRIHNDGLWEQINRLNVGDRCCLVTRLDHPSYEIIGKEVYNGTVEYIVQSVIGYMVCVDQTDIRPWRSADCGSDCIGGLTKLTEAVERKEELWKKRTEVGVLENKVSRSLVAELKYFQSTVIDPRSVLTVDRLESDEWPRNSAVNFRLGESYRKYSGSLQWTGLINKVQAAVVQVDNLMPDDILCQYTCSNEVVGKMKISSTDDLMIVLLATVFKREVEQKRLYIERVFQFIQKKELNVDILLDIIRNEDMSCLAYVAQHWIYPINLERYPDLLPLLIRQDSYDIISLMLNYFLPTPNDNLHLLNVAKYFLLMEDYKTFAIASAKCTDPNIILGNGETFLTDILKEIDDETVINKVIGPSIFDVNKPNEEGQSPLVLASKKLMVSTIRLLLGNGALISNQHNSAVDTVTDVRNNTNDPVRLQQALEIIAIFAKEDRPDYNICPICMDRKIDTALNCGHTMCEICAGLIRNCSVCSSEITERKRIFLP